MSDDDKKSPGTQRDRTTKNAEPTQYVDDAAKQEADRYNQPSDGGPQKPFEPGYGKITDKGPPAVGKPVDWSKSSDLPTFLGGGKK